MGKLIDSQRLCFVFFIPEPLLPDQEGRAADIRERHNFHIYRVKDNFGHIAITAKEMCISLNTRAKSYATQPPYPIEDIEITRGNSGDSYYRMDMKETSPIYVLELPDLSDKDNIFEILPFLKEKYFIK